MIAMEIEGLRKFSKILTCLHESSLRIGRDIIHEDAYADDDQ